MNEPLVEAWLINNRVKLMLLDTLQPAALLATLSLTLKQCGFRLTDRLRWGMWDWNKT